MQSPLPILAALLLALPAAGAAGEPDWPGFRGVEAGNQAADDTRLPTDWSASENVVWSTPVPGLGWSSPIVAGDRVFVTTVTSEGSVEEPRRGLYNGGHRPEPSTDVHHWKVLAFDRETGAVAWESTVRSGSPGFPRHVKNTYASETPTTDGERVYAYFGNAGLYALDASSGELLWEHDLGVHRTRYGWGTAASPVLWGDRLYVVNDNEERSFLAAIDKRSGREIFRTLRAEGSNWATPFVWRNELRTELVTAGTDEVRSYDEEGTLLWHLRGMSSIAIPQPFAADGHLYVTSGYVGDLQRPVYAIRPGARGDITLTGEARSNEWIAWSLPQAGPYNPTPLVYRGILYTLLDRGFVTAHDAGTGKEIYAKQRIERGASAFTASPWAYNDTVFALSEDCDAFALAAGTTFRVVAKSSLDDMCMATPAIVDGSLYLRTRSRLYRLSNRGGAPADGG